MIQRRRVPTYHLDSFIEKPFLMKMFPWYTGILLSAAILVEPAGDVVSVEWA